MCVGATLVSQFKETVELYDVQTLTANVTDTESDDDSFIDLLTLENKF